MRIRRSVRQRLRHFGWSVSTWNLNAKVDLCVPIRYHRMVTIEARILFAKTYLLTWPSESHGFLKIFRCSNNLWHRWAALWRMPFLSQYMPLHPLCCTSSSGQDIRLSIAEWIRRMSDARKAERVQLLGVYQMLDERGPPVVQKWRFLWLIVTWKGT